MSTKTVTCKAFTKAVDEEARTVEQIVSVFGNVDLGKDRVNFGAFAGTLERWKNSPNTMPAYFSHQWDDPFSNVGGVIEAEEVPPGDERLPDDQVVTEDGKTLRDLGGLLVKYQFDPEGQNPKADQVFRLLVARRIYQASFAYDILSNRRNSDGVNDLDELELIEVGPTLLGMNPATTLLSAKSIAAETGLEEDQVTAVLKAAQKDANHTFIASEDDPTNCMLCGRGVRAVAHISRLANEDGPDGTKRVQFAGSIEERQDSLLELGRAWAMDNDVGNGGFYTAYLEATFESTVIFLVEGWSDPVGEGVYFEASITENEDGTIAISDPIEVVVEQNVRPKSRAKDLDYLARRKEAATILRQDDETGTGTGNGQAGNSDPETEPETNSETEVDDNGELERVQLEADALLLEV